MLSLMYSLISIAVLAGPPASTFGTIPKHAPNAKWVEFRHGVSPGSPVKDSSKSTATFQRVEVSPVALRLLVRTNCHVKPTHAELINKAKDMTKESGPVVEIDWETVDAGKDITFYAVFCSATRVTDVDLAARDGKYMISNHRVRTPETWSVEPLSFAGLGGTCVSPDDVDAKPLGVALLNVLTRLQRQVLEKASAP